VTTLTLAPEALDRIDGEPTLDDLIMDVWEGLSVRRAVRCPVCDGEMEPLARAGSRGVAGYCHDCGTTLR
jgi:hypothetical protein